jgi:hypothetical protein
VFKHLQEKRPGDSVEGLCEIHLEQNRRTPLSIDPTASEQHSAEVLVNPAPLDESRLIVLHDV